MGLKRIIKRIYIIFVKISYNEAYYELLNEGRQAKTLMPFKEYLCGWYRLNKNKWILK